MGACEQTSLHGGASIWVLSVSAVGATRLGTVEANPYLPPTPVISVSSPASTVNVTEVPLVVEVKVPAFGSVYGFEGVNSLNYTLDYQASVPLTLALQGEVTTAFDDPNNPFNGDPYYLYLAKDTLHGLTNGEHNLTVMGESVFAKPLNLTLAFEVYSQNSENQPTFPFFPSPSKPPSLSPSIPEFPMSLVLFLLVAVVIGVLSYKVNKLKD